LQLANCDAASGVLRYADLGSAYPLRCQHCRRKKGMRILLWDGEPSGTRDPHDAGAHIVIVEGEGSERMRI
jgi:hypothetical protein